MFGRVTRSTMNNIVYNIGTTLYADMGACVQVSREDVHITCDISCIDKENRILFLSHDSQDNDF